MQCANELIFALSYTRPYISLMTIADRLDQAMRFARFKSQNALARASGIPQPTINRALGGKGKKGPETETLKALAAACHVNFEWLNEGIGEMVRSTARRSESLMVASDNIEIPQYLGVGGSMGNGVLLRDQPGEIHSWRVTPEWVQKNVRSHSSVKNLAIVTGFGDSMRGMFNPGDPLLVDRGIKTVEVDAVYFFRVGNEGFIKRLQRVPGEGLIALSENKAYRDWTIKPDMDFEVLARVIKVWQSEDF